jgi:Fe-S-cluster containining protein
VQFIRWDWEQNLAICYERTGECNRCGDCCKAVINVAVPNYSHSEKNDEDKRGMDIWVETYPDKNLPEISRGLIRFSATRDKTRCYALAPKNTCSLNGEKPWVCTIWPTCPDDIRFFNRCSYSFIEINKWKFDND